MTAVPDAQIGGENMGGTVNKHGDNANGIDTARVEDIEIGMLNQTVFNNIAAFVFKVSKHHSAGGIVFNKEFLYTHTAHFILWFGNHGVFSFNPAAKIVFFHAVHIDPSSSEVVFEDGVKLIFIGKQMPMAAFVQQFN
ncbi:hypothetical protein SDC9_192854 [bioreactor metagenome]|uniref:Uncharacterized protein n=1 Tax=bioreactor metagenome TaxID=1076179 RepID=A0A645I1W0_9ZZZZ